MRCAAPQVELAELLFGEDVAGGGEAQLARSHASASWAPTKSGWLLKDKGGGGEAEEQEEDSALVGEGEEAETTR